MPALIASARSPMSVAPFASARMAARMFCGFSLRGLSSVTMTSSAFAAAANGEPCGDQRTLDLEFADQRQLDRVSAPAMFEHEFLRKAFDRCFDKTDTLGPVGTAADGDDPQGTRPRRIDHLLRALVIG